MSASAPAPARLDPVGRLRLPRPAATIRAVIVAVLLLTAAGVLYAGEDPAPAGPRPDPPAGMGQPGGMEHPGGMDQAGTQPDPPATTADAVAPGHPADPGLIPAPAPGARLPIPDGMVGVPVPLGDPAGLAALHPGDRVDLLTIPTAGGDAVPLADAAPVLAVDHAAAALLLALTPEQGRTAVSVSATGTFAIVLRPHQER